MHLHARSWKTQGISSWRCDIEEQVLLKFSRSRVGVGNLLPLATIAVGFVFALRRLDDYDTWWHLASGRWIFDNRTIPATDTLSFTVPDHPWINLQWLYDLVLYFLYSIGGANLLVLTAAAAFATALWLMMKKGRNLLKTISKVEAGELGARTGLTRTDDEIGQVVEKPELGENRKVVVVIAIREDLLLPADTVFQIVSLSLLGDKAIVVSIPNEASPENLREGAFLQGGGPSGLEAIQGDAESIAADARVLMGNAKTSLLKLDAALDDVRAVAGRLSEGVEKINTGLLSDENLDGFSESIVSIKASAGNMEQASRELKPLMVDARATMDKVAQVADEARGTFAKANSQIDSLEPALREVPEAIRNISRVAETANEAIGDIKSSDGLIGTLAYDKEIKSDSKTFVKNLRRYGILGYRDEETSDENDPRERFKGRRR